MTRGRRLLGQLVLVLAMMAAGFVEAKLGLLGTREVGASHNFEDVPDDAFFHDLVQFLVDNMITAGCSVSPPRYCGDDPVTRGQMAVFLKKLSDLVDERVAALVATNTDALQGQITALQTALVAALGDTPCVRREGTEVIFEGSSITSISGSTPCPSMPQVPSFS